MGRKVIVAGGGASGMMAAISAARRGAEVTIIEQNDRVGRKLLSTGNGKCNLTNQYQAAECYRSEDPSFPWKVIKKFDRDRTLSFFEGLGVHVREKNGCYYPYPEQASAVLDVLRLELERLRIYVLTETKCSMIEKKDGRFLLDTNKGQLFANAVILACGSKASQVRGSDGSGYMLARRLGHRILPVLPALVQLRCREDFYKRIAGIRIQGKVSLYADGRFLAEEEGELQLTDYGISGIPVFQVSRYAAKALYEKKKVKAVLDFMPGFTEERLDFFLRDRIRQHPEKQMQDFFIGLFHKKLGSLWIGLAGIEQTKTAGELTERERRRLVRLIRCFETQVVSTNPFEQAQVCCGGADTRQVSAETLGSLLVPGLYFAGEILDVDGMCGGYNLQWAWSSGFVSGKEAADAAH